jgi:hypothetical protein
MRKEPIYILWAGSSLLKNRKTSAHADVFLSCPRKCGEYAKNAEASVEGPGSPPQMRGRFIAIVIFVLQGHPPAHAGNTCCCFRHGAESSVHPRGPPPLGRGMRQTKLHHGKSTWSTPTCVGKTSCHQQNEARPPGHPRLGGEDLVNTVCGFFLPGTPPHVRGNASVIYVIRA